MAGQHVTKPMKVVLFQCGKVQTLTH